MQKIFLLLSVLSLSVYCYAADVALGLERHYEKKDSLTTNRIISSEEIEQKNTGQKQALELVSDVPGIIVTGTGDTGRIDPVIRGFGDSCRRINVLVDGKPEKMAMFGCGVSHSMLAGNIDRIEIIKGSDSILYGSGALGGAINIITKQPVSPLEGTIDISAGSFNTQNSKIYLGGTQNNITYEVSADKVSSDGHVPNSQYNATDIYEKLGYIFKDGSVLSLQAKQYSGKKYEPGEEYAKKAKPAGSPYWEDYNRGSLQLNYDKSFDKSALSLKAFSSYGNHKFQDGFHSRDLTLGGYADYNLNIGNKNLLKAGAEFIQQEARLISSSYGKGSWKTSSYALYALDEHNFGEKIKAVLGARYNEDETSGSFFAPKAGIEYKLGNNTSLKALFSQGFRAPYLNELYVVPAKNKDLDAEVVNNYEVGFKTSCDKIIFDITAFVMKGDNLIQQVENVVKPPRYTFRNNGEFEFKGSELSLKYLINNNFYTTLGYTYFDAGIKTQGRPRDKVDFGITFTKSKFTFDIFAMYIGEYYAKNNHEERLDDFCKLNAKISYNVNDSVKLYVAGENLTNQKYYMYLDRSDLTEGIFEMPCAAVTVGSQIKF